MDGEEGGPYETSKKIRDHYKICNNTLRGWSDSKKVRTLRLGEKGKRLYSVPDIRAMFQLPPQSAIEASFSDMSKPRAKIVYARVSSKKQEADLSRQRDFLREKFPEHEIVEDIASGINFKRRGLQSVLDRAMRGCVEEVVVCHRDRLCRVAFDLLEYVFKKCGTKIVVLDHDVDAESDGNELRDDLLAIVTYFVASNNGKRAGENRRRRAREKLEAASEEEDEEGEKGQPERKRGRAASESEEDTDISDDGAEAPVSPHF